VSNTKSPDGGAGGRPDPRPIVWLTKCADALTLEACIDQEQTLADITERPRYVVDRFGLLHQITPDKTSPYQDITLPNRGEQTMSSEALTGYWKHTTDASDLGTLGPRPGKDGDAGYDLTAAEPARILPGDVGQVPCGIAVQMPPGIWGLIQGRSSSWRRGLSVKASVIDAGYRGDLWVDCLNIGPEPVLVAAGERIAQLIPMPLMAPITFVQTDILSDTERGSDGYGSTGR